MGKNSSYSGFFITFEGGEGTGKTTQIGLLAGKLRAAGREVVTTREPGGTPEAEKIRELLVQREGGDWTPMAECLLLFAGRTMHLETLIRPALEAGKVVISDRFTDSTRAYQSFGHGLPRQQIEAVKQASIGDFEPDLTFILDLPPAQGLERAGKRLAADASAEDRFERLNIGFHEKLRQGYLAIAAQDPQRCRVIDADRPIEDIAADLERITKEKLDNV